MTATTKPTASPSRWTGIIVTIAGTLIPLLAAGIFAWGALSSSLTQAQADIADLRLADIRLGQTINTKISRDELKDSMDQLNQRLVDLRADLRAYYRLGRAP